MNKCIVVFGATGETGRYFIDYFTKYPKSQKNKYRLIAVGTRKTDFFLQQYNIEYFSVDITKKSDFEKLPQDVYAVVDLAGYMPARMSGYDPSKHVNINLVGTINILEYCIKAHADRILFCQSFGDIKDHAEETVNLKVDLPRKFSLKTDHSVYIIAKNAAVDVIEHYHQMYGLKNFIFRLPTIYMYAEQKTFCVNGINQPLWYRVLIDKAIKGEELEIWGDIARVKDMVYVKDFCQMLYLALFIDRTNGFYNVGTGVGTSLSDQFEGIRKVFCSHGNISNFVYCPTKRDSPQYIMDITEARNELGYSPSYTYLKYLEDYKREMQAQRFILLDKACK